MNEYSKDGGDSIAPPFLLFLISPHCPASSSISIKGIGPPLPGDLREAGGEKEFFYE